MNNNLGLLRLTDYVHQDDIKLTLSVAFEDLYSTLGQAREDARSLEDAINGILYGSGAGERSAYRSLRQKLLDPRG
jgi:hypothetical protein